MYCTEVCTDPGMHLSWIYVLKIFGIDPRCQLMPGHEIIVPRLRTLSS